MEDEDTWFRIDELDFSPDQHTPSPLSLQHGVPTPTEPEVSLNPIQQSMLQSLTNSEITSKRKLTCDKQSYITCTKKFNDLRRCIQIILNDKLMRVAVFEDSFVRRVVNTFAHEKHKYSDKIHEVLASSAKLIEESGLSEPEGEQDINYEEVLKEIEEQLYSSSDYFEMGKSTTEERINLFIANIATSAAEEENSDYHILLQWLDLLKPIPAESI